MKSTIDFVLTLVLILSFCDFAHAGKGKDKGKERINERDVTSEVQSQDVEDLNDVLYYTKQSSDDLSEGHDKDSEDEDSKYFEIRKKNLVDKQEKYCTGNLSIKKVCKTLFKETASTLFTAGLTAMGTYCALSYVQPNQNDQGSTIALATTLTTTVSTAVNGSIQNIMKAIRECRMTFEEGLKAVFAELVKESNDYVKTLPEDFQEKIKSFDVKIAQFLENKNTDIALKLIKRREEVYLAYPNQVKNIAHYDINGDGAIEKKIDARVKKLMDQYPENREALDVLIQSIRDNSIVKEGQRVQAYLYGPAGTGKTTFVRNLGKALGVHVCEIKLTDLDASELLGPEYPDDHVGTSDAEAIGKIGDCFRQAGYKNIIIFFDEAGEYLGEPVESKGFDVNAVKKQMIQAQFKKIMDPNDQFIFLKGVGVKLDASRATFIMAGNYPVKNEALLSRTPQLHFKELKLSEKRKAAEEGFNKTIATLSEFSREEDVRAIGLLAKEYFEFILEEDNKRNPGGRIIKDVMKEFISHVRIRKMNEKKGGNPATDEQLKAFILESFKRREKIEEAAPSASSSSSSQESAVE